MEIEGDAPAFEIRNPDHLDQRIAIWADGRVEGFDGFGGPHKGFVIINRIPPLIHQEVCQALECAKKDAA